MSEAEAAAPPDPRLAALHDGIFEAFNRRDWDRFFTYGTEEIVIRTDPKWPGGGEFRGREEIMRFMGQFLEPWEQLRYESVGEPLAVEGRLVERGTWVASGRSSGISGTVEFTVVVTPAGDRIARADFFLEHEDALDFARSQPSP